MKAVYSPADMSKPKEIEEMITLAEKTFGRLDVLVNNAGVQHVSPIEEFPVDKWERDLAINLSSAFHRAAFAVSCNFISGPTPRSGELSLRELGRPVRGPCGGRGCPLPPGSPGNSNPRRPFQIKILRTEIARCRQALPILDGKDTGAKLYRSRPPQALQRPVKRHVAMPRASPIWAWLRGAAQEFHSVMPLALAL